MAAIGTACWWSGSRMEMKTDPERGSCRPAARSALSSAVERSAALAITSPVERISGPRTGSLPGKRAKGSTAALTLHCRGGPLRRQPELRDRRPEREAARRLDELDSGRLAHEGDRPRRARIRLEHVDLSVARDRELDVEEPDGAERAPEDPDDVRDLLGLREREARRGQHARRVAGVDARLLDVLHDRGDVRVDAVAERVDVHLDRVLDEAVDEDPLEAAASSRTSSAA